MKTRLPDAWLLLPRLQVQNASAISGPYSWGFPPPSAFAGFVHALSRQGMSFEGQPISLDGVGVISHKFEPQVSDGFIKTFSLTRNPVDKSGASAPFVEEGRAHLEVSLLVGVYSEALIGVSDEDFEEIAQIFADQVPTLRLAGGTIQPLQNHNRPLLVAGTIEPNKITRRLLPGFALVERNDRLAETLEMLRQEVPDATPLDALVEATSLHWDCVSAAEEDSDEVEWKIRARDGWVVPLPVGYRALSPLYSPGEVLNARDAETPFRFVEALYGLGEWISPHRVESLEQLLWYHQSQPDQDIYRFTNSYLVQEDSHV